MRPSIGSPRFLRAFQGISVAVYAATWVLAVPTGWIRSIAFISHVTMATAVSTAFSAWQSARVEVKQDEQRAA